MVTRNSAFVSFSVRFSYYKEKEKEVSTRCRLEESRLINRYQSWFSNCRRSTGRRDDRDRETRDFGLNRHIYTKGRKDNFFSRDKRIPRGNFVNSTLTWISRGMVDFTRTGRGWTPVCGPPFYRRLFFFIPIHEELVILIFSSIKRYYSKI